VADRPSEEERRRLIRQYQTIAGGITSIDYHEVALEVWRFAAEVRKGPSG